MFALLSLLSTSSKAPSLSSSVSQTLPSPSESLSDWSSFASFKQLSTLLHTLSLSTSLSTTIPVPSISPEHVSHIPSMYKQLAGSVANEL